MNENRSIDLPLVDAIEHRLIVYPNDKSIYLLLEIPNQQIHFRHYIALLIFHTLDLYTVEYHTCLPFSRDTFLILAVCNQHA